MSLPVLVGFAGVLVAVVATGLLVKRCVRQPRIDVILWTAAAFVLAAALAAQSTGFDRGFSGATFRIASLGALLLAPLGLGWGLVELVTSSEAVRFGARLIFAALLTVGAVILATDPLAAPPAGTSWPSAGSFFQPVALGALDVVQVAAVAAAVVSVILAAARARQDPRWRSALPGIAAVCAAALLAAGMRAGWPDASAYPLLGLLAVALVWFGAIRAEPGGDRVPAVSGGRVPAVSGGRVPAVGGGWDPSLAGGGAAGNVPGRDYAAAGPATARPYSRILIFTLLDDRAAEFDRLAEQTAEQVSASEPGTLVYVSHLVPNAPLQRIFYEIYRDRAAFARHESQPYVRRFMTDCRPCVRTTNVIELMLKTAKVAPLAGPPAPDPAAASPAPGVVRAQRPPETSRGRPAAPWLEPLPPGGTLSPLGPVRTPATRPQARLTEES